MSSHVSNADFLYFFSTVSQTLGSVLAFSGVFIVFRLENINVRGKDTYSEILQKSTAFVDRTELELLKPIDAIKNLEQKISGYKAGMPGVTSQRSYAAVGDYLERLMGNYKHLLERRNAIV